MTPGSCHAGCRGSAVTMTENQGGEGSRPDLALAATRPPLPSGNSEEQRGTSTRSAEPGAGNRQGHRDSGVPMAHVTRTMAPHDRKAPQGQGLMPCETHMPRMWYVERLGPGQWGGGHLTSGELLSRTARSTPPDTGGALPSSESLLSSSSRMGDDGDRRVLETDQSRQGAVPRDPTPDMAPCIDPQTHVKCLNQQMPGTNPEALRARGPCRSPQQTHVQKNGNQICVARGRGICGNRPCPSSCTCSGSAAWASPLPL